MQDLLRIKKKRIDETFIYEVEHRNKYKENAYLETTPYIYISYISIHTSAFCALFLRTIFIFSTCTSFFSAVLKEYTREKLQ